MELPTGPREAVVSWRRTEDRYRDALRLAGAADTLREQDGGRASLVFLAGVLGDPEAEPWPAPPRCRPAGLGGGPPLGRGRGLRLVSLPVRFALAVGSHLV